MPDTRDTLFNRCRAPTGCRLFAGFARIVFGLSIGSAYASMGFRFLAHVCSVPQKRFDAFDHGGEELWHYSAIFCGCMAATGYMGYELYVKYPMAQLNDGQTTVFTALFFNLICLLLFPQHAWFFWALAASFVIVYYTLALLDLCDLLIRHHYGKGTTRVTSLHDPLAPDSDEDIELDLGRTSPSAVGVRA